MTRIAHWLNCGLWLANAATWSLYAGNVKMGLASLAASALAGYLAWKSDPWDSIR